MTMLRRFVALAATVIFEAPKVPLTTPTKTDSSRFASASDFGAKNLEILV